MMRRVIGASMRFRFIVLAMAVGMLLLAAGQFRTMPVDVFPEFAPPRVEIQTAALGLAPADVESFVTIPLEQALAGVEGLDILRSKSVPQLSSIELIFKPGTDLLRARQLVQERVTAVTPSLPTWAAPPMMLQPLSATSRVMKIGMSSSSMSVTDMSLITYWTIRSRLLSVQGVANVPIWGEQLSQLHVQVVPKEMAAHHVSLDQVMEATAEALDAGILFFSEGHVIGTGGFVDTPNQRLTVRHVPAIVGADDLKNVKLKTLDGQLVNLSDVAEIEKGHQPLFGDAVVNDGPGLLLVVEKFPWANTLDVTRGVEQALAELEPGLPGITFDTTIFRPADFIEIALANLTNALLLGSLLVFVVLILFLFDWRTALISLIAIPLSLTAAALVLAWQGATINTMILAGLVISVGVVVDDAIIDIENIVRRLRLHRREGGTRSTASVILESSVEVRSAIIYATLIDVVAIAPVFFIEGLSGAFFRPLAIAYGLAVLASLGVALTVTPALALILLRNAPVERRESPVARRLQAAYAAFLGRLVRSARPAFATVAAISLVGFAVAPQLGQSLFPEFKERDFLMHWISRPGTSLPEESRIVLAASRELRSIPGVRNFGAHIGQALMGEEVAGVDFGENWISIDPAADYDETRDAVEEMAAGYPGLFRNVETYLNERIDEVLTGSSDAIVVRIYGPDLAVLREKADEVEAALSTIDGIEDVHGELQVEVPQIQVEVDLAAAQRYGLKPGDVRRAAATLVSSEEVGDVFNLGKAYDVHVWSTPGTRSTVSDIETLPIDTADGRQIALKDVASVTIAPTPNSIVHENLARRITVGANVSGTRDLGAIVGDVQRRIDGIGFEQGYHPEIVGELAERDAAQGRLLLFALGAVAGVFLLLQASFGRSRLALLTLLTLPSALVGGVLAAFLTGGVISLGSLVGFFTVLGIAARNGIMMINHFQHLESVEGEPFGPGLVVRGARERLSPILMTALATGLALVPLAIAGDLPGHEIEHPMAIVILGGLVTSTLLNLFITPSLYLRFGRGRQAPVRTEPATPGPAPA
jgi:CzcA family heavy metal efflux pump